MNDTNTNKADDMNEDDVTLTGSEGENTAVESDAAADATADTATIRALVPASARKSPDVEGIVVGARRLLAALPLLPLALLRPRMTPTTPVRPMPS